MANYDSGNEYLDKLQQLIDCDKSYFWTTWEMDFIANLKDQMTEFEIGNKNLSDGQKEKIDEIYDKHFGD